MYALNMCLKNKYITIHVGRRSISPPILYNYNTNLGISDRNNMPRLNKVMENKNILKINRQKNILELRFLFPFDNLPCDLKSRFNEDLMSAYDLDEVLPNIVKIKAIFDDKCKLETKIKNVINQFGDLVACKLNIPRNISISLNIATFLIKH